MPDFSGLIDLVLHVDRHLPDLVTQFGPWIYGLMFLVVFCETGLVVTPFLPGDSLLFALGAFAAVDGGLSLPILLLLLSIAAIAGDSVNYLIGAKLADRIVRGEHVKLLNRRHLERTHEFFERYGAKAIILARFAPIVRTFAPFVAGMGHMTYRRFMAYNVIGGVVWVWMFLLLGYGFSQTKMVRENFTWVILGIVFLSLLPPAFEIWREWRRCRRQSNCDSEPASTPAPEAHRAETTESVRG